MTASSPLPADEPRARLRGRVDARFRASTEVPARFAETHAPMIAGACEAMARRFERGGRLLVFGQGAGESDARHVAVEFMHPVLVGKRALPALALPGPFAPVLAALGHADDIALGLSHGGRGGVVAEALARARRMGMLTLALTGGADPAAEADFVFAVPESDPMVVQEVHETLYHVMWELVHVFFDARGAA